MKYLLIALIFLSGCGEYGDRQDRELLHAYKQDCISRGYTHIQVTYLFGRPSAYYKCL